MIEMELSKIVIDEKRDGQLIVLKERTATASFLLSSAS